MRQKSVQPIEQQPSVFASSAEARNCGLKCVVAATLAPEVFASSAEARNCGFNARFDSALGVRCSPPPRRRVIAAVMVGAFMSAGFVVFASSAEARNCGYSAATNFSGSSQMRV